ncbi:transposable element Tcb2 transposase [Trichonephila clavipes]|nr:transposable element Tcb2 transposase [Trichonephila clavipes]
MEAGWSARQVARQLGSSDCIVRRCWDQWIREMSFTRRPYNQDTLNRPVVEKTTTSGPLSSRTIRRRLAEGHLGSRRPLRVLSLTPTHGCLRLEWCRARGNWSAAIGTRSSLATNPDSISAVKTIVFVCGDPVPDRSTDVSPIEHIWDHLGRLVGHPTSLNELEARLQKIWNEMSQDIIHILYYMSQCPIVSHREFVLEGVQQGIISFVLLPFSLK